MELLHERCAALDIGKKDLKACVRAPSPKGKRSRRQEIRTYATTTNARPGAGGEVRRPPRDGARGCSPGGCRSAAA